MGIEPLMKCFISFLFLLLVWQVPARGAVSPAELQRIFAVFDRIYEDQFLFNDTNNGTINWLDYNIYRAAYHRSGDNQYIWVFGGLIRADFMTVDGAALIICHEIGHGLGGPPYKMNGSTTEGQSDYFATGECLDLFFAKWERPLLHSELNHPAKEFCQDESCLRKLSAIDVQREYFFIHEEARTSYFIPDPTVVSEVSREDSFYPSAQCRLDTYLAGALGEERPRCWWAPELSE